MRKFIISSENFSGQIGLAYAPDGQVLGIDFTGCELSQPQAEYFLRKVPAVYSKPAWDEAFSRASLKIVVEDIKVEFADFWEAYGVKHNKVRCETLWRKMNETEKTRAVHGITAYDRFLKANAWRTKAEPDTYLKGKYWDNEWK